MNLQEMIRTEMTKMDQARDSLMEHPKIKPLLASVEKYMLEEHNRPINMHEKRNVAQCLYNAILETGVKQNSRLFETTTMDNISFLGIQLPVIAALLPTLVLNEVSIVQAIDRRIAAVFYMDVKYGNAKGEAAADETMISSTTGHNTGLSERRYAMAHVSRETIGTSDDGTHAGTVSYAPGLINLENVVVEQKVGTTYTTLGTADADGHITGTSISGTGTIDAAGVYLITVTGAPSGATILLSYDYQYDLPEDVYGNPDGVPEATIEVTQSAVEAMDFPLRAKWSLGAEIDLKKAHGIDLENELVKYLGGEIKFTIDQKGLAEIDDAAAGAGAATAPTVWDARPSQGEAWVFKKLEFLDRIQEGSNNIFDKTKRGIATFMVCGNDVARVIKQLGKDHFTPAPTVQIPTGPIKIGVLDNQVTVIQNPFKTSTAYTLGFRGPDYMHAGFIYCPYIPLFATPTLTTSDLISQKGFMSSAAFKTINAGLFCASTISNLAGGYVLGSEN